MSRIRAFLFDMDGVIIDSNPTHVLAWEEYNRRQGVELTEEMRLRMYGRRNDELIRDFLGDGLTDVEVFAHGAAKEALYRELMLPLAGESLVPGVRELLARHAAMKMAVATNGEGPNVDLVLDGAGLRSHFPVVLNGGQVTNPKPHPEIYLRAAELLGASPSECVVFEDSHTGVAAGLAAGMRVVGLSTTHDELPGVSLLIPDFHDPKLAEWLDAACL